MHELRGVGATEQGVSGRTVGPVGVGELGQLPVRQVEPGQQGALGRHVAQPAGAQRRVVDAEAAPLAAMAIAHGPVQPNPVLGSETDRERHLRDRRGGQLDALVGRHDGHRSPQGRQEVGEEPIPIRSGHLQRRSLLDQPAQLGRQRSLEPGEHHLAGSAGRRRGRQPVRPVGGVTDEPEGGIAGLGGLEQLRGRPDLTRQGDHPGQAAVRR